MSVCEFHYFTPPTPEAITKSMTGSVSFMINYPHWICRAHGVPFYTARDAWDPPRPGNCIAKREEWALERERQARRVAHARKLHVRLWRWARRYFGNLWSALRGDTGYFPHEEDDQ